VLRVPQITGIWHHDGGNGAQPDNDLSRFVEPSEMGIAGCEKAIGLSERRKLL